MKAKQPQERPLPHDDGAEQALLGALIYGTAQDWEERNPAVLGRVHPRHFYWLQHSTLYIAIARVYQRHRQGKGGAVDVIEVASELRRSNLLCDETCPVYDESGQLRSVHPHLLPHLLSVCPNTSNSKAYADTVIECAQLRSIYQLGTALRRVIMAEAAPESNDFSEMGGQPLGSDPDRILNAAKRALDQIETKGRTDFAVLFQDSK